MGNLGLPSFPLTPFQSMQMQKKAQLLQSRLLEPSLPFMCDDVLFIHSCLHTAPEGRLPIPPRPRLRYRGYGSGDSLRNPSASASLNPLVPVFCRLLGLWIGSSSSSSDDNVRSITGGAGRLALVEPKPRGAADALSRAELLAACVLEFWLPVDFFGVSSRRPLTTLTSDISTSSSSSSPNKPSSGSDWVLA